MTIMTIFWFINILDKHKRPITMITWITSFMNHILEHEVTEYKLCTKARVWEPQNTITPLLVIIRIERLDPERLMYFQVNFNTHHFKRLVYLYGIIFKINYIRILSLATQPAFTCSCWAMETLEQCGKSI